MAPEFSLPVPSFLPSSLPGENAVGNGFNKVSTFMRSNLIGKGIGKLESTFPRVKSSVFPTPFGKINTPEFRAPSILPPVLNERQKEVVKSAVGEDVMELIQLIPGVGDFADAITAPVGMTYHEKVHSLLSPEEYKTFINLDEQWPLSTMAALNTFSKHPGDRHPGEGRMKYDNWK
jgi:hypothetical protein